jgi:Zn-finger nucleic acid-binding protein
MADRSGVEIDYCPKCRGVWLDRGELDKIIDRSAAQTPAAAPVAPPPPQHAPQPHHQPQSYGHPRQGHYRDEDDGHYRKKRRESFLGDLFDF